MKIKQTFWRTLFAVATMLLTMPTSGQDVVLTNEPEPYETYYFDGPGTGTESDPFVIANFNHLTNFLKDIRFGLTFEGAYIVLVNDLYCNYMTIQARGTFSGNFDGQHHTISAINIEGASTSGTGLFSELRQATVKNLIVDAGVGLNSYSGVIAGKAYSSTISGCQSRGSVYGNSYVGGIVGYASGSNVINCENQASVTGSSNAGGIVGRSEDCSISSCVNTAAIGAQGGIVGRSDRTRLNDNLNLGKVAGCGIVGTVGSRIQFEQTYFSNNYYTQADNLAIAGQDISGRAMRGYGLTASDDIIVELCPLTDGNSDFVGVAYDGTIYVGAGETTRLLIGRAAGAPEGDIVASAGTLVLAPEVDVQLAPRRAPGASDEPQYYLFTMPEDGGDVVFSIETSIPTGIDTIAGDNSADDIWYTISGMRLHGKPTTAGIYINGHKKVVIR